MTSSSKKILIVTHHYPPHITGVGFVAQNQAQSFAALGHTVTLVTSDTGPAEKSFFAEGVDVIRIKALNVSESWNAPFPIFSPRLLWVLLKQVRRADIVHIHDVFYMSSFFAAVVAWLYKKPIVLTQHVAIVSHPNKIIMLIQKVVYATTGAMIFYLSDSIILYNHIVKKFLINNYNINPNKIIELRNGVDFSIFQPATDGEKLALRRHFNLPEKKPIVLFVGRLVPKKGFLKLLEARDDSYDIVFAGPGTLDERLKVSGIHCVGSMSQHELAKLYRTADLFVFPAEGEMFTLAMQEAMASGLPVITTNEKEYEEYDVNRNLIVFVEPTPTELKKNIKLLLSDKQLMEKMSSYSISLAKEWFDYKNNLDHLFKLYFDLSQKKKKIAIVSDAVYPFNKGGKEKRIYDMTTRLASRGHDVTVYCMNWWKGENMIVRDGVTLHAISPFYPLYAGNRRSITEAIFFALHCLKLINKDFDIVEVDHVPHLMLFTMKVVCLLRRKQMIVTWHEVWGKKYWREYLGVFGGTVAYWIERVGVRLPDVIVSVSEHTTRGLEQTLGRTKNVITIPNGLDTEFISNSVPAEQKSDIIFVGRFLPNKNIDVLLHAIVLLREKIQNVSVCIVGEGPEKQNLIELADGLDLHKNVTFLPFFENHADVYGLMKSSRVFVLPSTREGFGITAIEANICGLPVVTIDHKDNAARELIVEGENGILSSLDAVQLAETIEKAFNMNKDRTVYKKYAEKYDLEKLVSKILTVYNY